MRQSQLNRAVAHATGESVRTIKRCGFSIVAPSTTGVDDEDADRRPSVVDWDQVEAERLASVA